MDKSWDKSKACPGFHKMAKILVSGQFRILYPNKISTCNLGNIQ